jgi:hypothetical protein
MMQYKQTVLHKIKSASDDQEIESVIAQSILRLKENKVNGHIIQRFVAGMDIALQHAKSDNMSEKLEHHMNVAIDLFRKLRKP